MNANRRVPSFSAGRAPDGHAHAEVQFRGGSDGNGWGRHPRRGGNERRR